MMIFTTVITTSTYLLILQTQLCSAVDINFDYFNTRNVLPVVVAGVGGQGTSNQTTIECPRFRCPISTVCNEKSNRCECANVHLVAVSSLMGCLTRKYLGESCITTAQCAHIANSICVSNGRSRAELAIMPPKLPLNTQLNTITGGPSFSPSSPSMSARILKHPEKYLSRNEYGRCECRPGYWPNQNQQCVLAKRLDLLDCSGSRQCPDENSRCDFFRHKCVCEFGHKYDAAHDRCLLNVDMFGVFCKEHLDCQLRHDQMHCLAGICTCINNNRYDPYRGCGHVQPCKAGQTWNDFSKSCEPTMYNYNQQQHRELDGLAVAGSGRLGYHRRWAHMSAEMWFKCFVFILFIVGMTFTLKNRKTCFANPPPVLPNGGNSAGLGNAQSRGHHRSLSSGGNGGGGRRVNRYNRGVEQQFLNPQFAPEMGRGVHPNVNVRVNLAEYDDLNERGALMVALPASSIPGGRRWSLGSNTSLPPSYDTPGYSPQTGQPLATELPASTALAATPLINGPPPSYDQLPTYDEAIREIEVADSCAKTVNTQSDAEQRNKDTPTHSAADNDAELSLNSSAVRMTPPPPPAPPATSTFATSSTSYRGHRVE